LINGIDPTLSCNFKNSFVTFKPGDNIEIHYRKKIYKGTAKAWGAEHNPNGRVVILNATAKQSKEQDLY
jgi:hypothetical protein